MSTIDNWNYLIGWLLPIIIAAIIRTKWTTEQKAFASFGICSVVGFVACYLEGKLVSWNNIDAVIANMLVIFAVAVATYVGGWKPSGITDWIESKTG